MLDVFSDKRYDVFWTPLAGTVWDSTHRRSGCAWQELDDSPGVIMAIPMTDGTPFCAFGDNSGFRHDYTRLKDHTFVAEVWGSSCWDHWPIGWLNSQGHPVDADSLKTYPNHFSPLGMDFFALANEVVERGEFYSLLGVSDGNWQATRASVDSGWRKANALRGRIVVLICRQSGRHTQAPIRRPSMNLWTRQVTRIARTRCPMRIARGMFRLTSDSRSTGFKTTSAELHAIRTGSQSRQIATATGRPTESCASRRRMPIRVTCSVKRPDTMAQCRKCWPACGCAQVPAGPHPIAGISVASSPAAEHAGEAINLIFLRDPGDCLGVAGPVARLVDDWRAWGPAIPDFTWENDVWYWLRLGQTSAESGTATNIRAKICAQMAPNQSPPIGRSSGRAMGAPGWLAFAVLHDGSTAECEVDYVLIKADGLPPIQVAPAACGPAGKRW